MDFRQFDMDLMGRDAMSWKIVEREDHAPVLKANHLEKLHGNNGWTPGRLQRRLASIPYYVVEWAKEQGYDMKGNGVYQFLHDHPEWLRVPYIKSPNNGSAISQGRVVVK